MDKTQDRKNLVREINKAADLYRKHLVGRRFLYVFDGRYIEVIFKAQNFRHLTGVNTNLSAKQFYRYASNNRLNTGQIGFDATHDYRLCMRKAKHLADIAILASSENFMLEEITTESRVFKFGTTDLNFSLCMDREYDEYGNIKGDCYVVESLRDEDCFSKSSSVYEVTHILARANDTRLYSEALFVDKRYNIADLSDEIKVMIEPELLLKDKRK